MSSNVIPFHYQGKPVRFNSDGWINATDIAAAHGMRLDNWLRNKETEAYIEALARHLNTSDSRDLIRGQRGRGGGTWLHPKLAVAFARWISPDFAVWADLHIDALLRGELTEKQAFDRACKQLEDGRQLASLHGKGLADWKFKKPMLEHRVDEMHDRLQMVLGLEAA
ncbi:TPA: DNA-binding protein [Pseudomonas aeruginosa]|uniref:KilA-N domain-containing protein n=1 Tax=Pseudomonas aeruginosa TaxID=287 RepID=UPI00249F900F|nr:KilA-N domain-containing protein [Pseudomonas aeruginosa]MDI4100869.1 KilA-N domain-containing protein [Pseudomonas aeruginosa]HBP1896764.1 DNA-binding protein [Pseudomonas aeruginosa]